MASRETELTHRQRHPCSLGPCLLTPAPREGGPCFPCLSRRGSSRVKAHGTPGHSCGAQSPWKPGSPLGTPAIPGSGGRVRWTLHGGAGGAGGEGTHAPAGPTPPAGSRRHHKQPPHRSLCTGLSSSRATPVQKYLSTRSADRWHLQAADKDEASLSSHLGYEENECFRCQFLKPQI